MLAVPAVVPAVRLRRRGRAVLFYVSRFFVFMYFPFIHCLVLLFIYLFSFSYLSFLFFSMRSGEPARGDAARRTNAQSGARIESRVIIGGIVVYIKLHIYLYINGLLCI